MREILLRGKSVNDGNWVQGSLVITTIEPADDAPIKHYHIEDMTIGVFPNEYQSGLSETVDPNTVGQFTGLTDKNGKKIFEGDILRIAKTADDFGGYYYPPLEYPVNVVVRWDFCAWMWETLCEDKRYISFPDAWCKFECEVIGNIHDNPELLEGGAVDG